MNPKMGRKSLQHQVHSIPKWKNATYRESQIDLLFLSTFLSNQNPPTIKKKPLYMHIYIFSFIHSFSLFIICRRHLFQLVLVDIGGVLGANPIASELFINRIRLHDSTNILFKAKKERIDVK